MRPTGAELLGRLLDAHGRALVLYARGWCEAPEDVVQEAFLKLARQPDVPDNPVAWLYRVVRNGAITAARAHGRRQRHERAAAEESAAWFVASDETRLDALEVTDSLRGLPVEQRETIVARLWGGLSFEEIAALGGTSSSTAHRRYQAGLAALRERLGVECPTTNARPKI